MAERDLRTPFTETSFCVPDDEQSFLLVQSAPIADPFKSALNDGQKSSSAISRFVKSAFDGAVNLGKTIAQVGTQSGHTQGGDNSFVQACKATSELLTDLSSKYGKYLVCEQVLKDVLKADEMLEMKEICISVFGQHNCGKSTLINAFIGEELLPVYEMSETSVKIKVQHDHNIHRGICSQNCSYQNAHRSQSKQQSCPKLQIIRPGMENEEINGVKCIFEYLTKLNKSVRQAKSVASPTIIILKVYIPLLADKVPHGWTVSLVDNPGFGEAKDHVVQLADASLLTSSAYIYLLQTENIGGTEVADFFKELARLDKTAMKDGRLAVGVTKFDNNYCASTRSSRRQTRQISVEKVKEKMIESINDAVETEVSADTIIPLCGEWALSASMLANCLEGDPNDEIKDRADDAVRALENYPHNTLPRGQGQSLKESIQQLNHEVLIQHLEIASGIADLKSRIHYVVGKACVKVWSTKLFSEYQRCVQDVEESTDTRCRYLSEVVADKQIGLIKAEDLLNDIEAVKEAIKATVPRKKKRTTAVWKEFEESYKKDLETYKPQDEGKMKVRALVKEFKDQCKCNISTTKFGPEDLKKSIYVFLKESEPKLQKVFDSSCGFWNVQSVLMQNVECMVERITKLRSSARSLCNMGPEEITESYRRPSIAEGRTWSAPHLADVKLKVTIPGVSLRWWEKLFNILFQRSVRSIMRDSESGKDEESKDSTSLNDKSKSTCESDDKLTKLDNEECEVGDIESDSDDDQNEVSAPTGSTSVDDDLFESCLKEEGYSSTASSHIDVHEETDDGGSKRQSTTKSKHYRKWSTELEDAITELQDHMEGECDRYFIIIMPKAIKFFYNDLSRKTNDRLDAFDRDFGKRLQEEHRRQKKVRIEIDVFQKEYYELQVKKFDLKAASNMMLGAYTREFASQKHQGCY